MKKLLKTKKCLLLLEFGIPHYRLFIYKYFKNEFNDFMIIHSGERFETNNVFKNKKCANLRLSKDISFTFFNFHQIESYDIIISTLNFRKPHTWLPFFFYTKKNWIFWGQGVSRNNNIFLNYLRKIIINKSIGYVAYTEIGKRNLSDIGVLPEKISIAYNTLKISNAELTWGNKYLLYIGRIQERKGIAKAILCLKNTNYTLVIVGDGNYVAELKKLVSENELGKQVFFMPAVYDEDKIKNIFSQAIAYISPDHVGLGVVHSFAYGVPVITCKNGNHAPEFEYCSDSNSYLYNHDSEISDILINVYNNHNIRKQKKESAYRFFNDELNYKNVIEAFNYQFKKIE